MGRDGQGATIGHQKRRLVAKKQKCSKLCQFSELSANSYARGMCHPTKETFIAIQATRGRTRNLAIWRRRAARKSGPSTGRTNQAGSPRSIGTTGAPNRMSGGAAEINT